jgi:hypothetical protein
MASTSKPFREAFINASNVSMLSWVLPSLLFQFCFKNPYLQMVILVGIISTHCHNDITIGQLFHGKRKLHNVAMG